MLKRVYATREFSFESAHYLPKYNGSCAEMHGHSYKLQVTVSGKVITEETINSTIDDFMVLDFKEIDRIVKEHIISTHDHKTLNCIYSFPTAEVMAVEIFNKLQYNFPADVKLENVRLWETANSFVEYRGE